MNTSEKSPRGLPMTTWLLLFCIFNLLVTLALFCGAVRKMRPMGYDEHMNYMGMQRATLKDVMNYSKQQKKEMMQHTDMMRAAMSGVNK